jgi:hypothetical protein
MLFYTLSIGTTDRETVPKYLTPPSSSKHLHWPTFRVNLALSYDGIYNREYKVN